MWVLSGEEEEEAQCEEEDTFMELTLVLCRAAAWSVVSSPLSFAEFVCRAAPLSAWAAAALCDAAVCVCVYVCVCLCDVCVCVCVFACVRILYIEDILYRVWTIERSPETGLVRCC